MKIFIVPHTHWDKEWYFIKDVSDVYLIDNIKNIIELNKINENEAAFCYDGQFSIIDDFLKFYPEKEMELKKLIKNKKLIIGPWYTQTDTFNVLGESIVRNLLLGTKLSEEFGYSMNVAYLPDTFGFNSNLPQIISQTNNLGIINWRGAEENLINGELFNLWKAEDGTLFPTYNLFRHGYFTGVGGLLSQYHNNWSKGRIANWDPKNNANLHAKNYIESIKGELDILKPLSKSTGGRVLIPVGSDQMPMVKGWKEIVDSMNNIDKENEYILSTFDEFMKELVNDKEVMKNLKVMEGQFRYGKYARAHKTITSSRYDIKDLSRKAENLLYKELEPLSVIFSSINGEYPEKIIIEIMKLLLSCHAHDSIGGCNTDETNRAIISRLESAIGLIEGQITLIKKRISESLNLTNNDILLFNLEPNDCKKTFEIDLNTLTESFSLFENEKEINFSIIDQIFFDNENFKISNLEDRNEILENKINKNEEEFQNATNMLMNENLSGKFKTKILFSLAMPGLGYKVVKLIENKNKPCEVKLDSNNFIENDYYRISLLNNELILFDKINNFQINDFFKLNAYVDAGDTYDYSPPIDKQTTISILKNVEFFKVFHNNISTLKLKFYYDFDDYNIELKNKKTLFNVDIILKDKIIDFKIDVVNNVNDIKWTANFKTNTKNNKYTYADQSFSITKRLTNDPKKEQSISEKWADLPIEIEACESLVYVKETNPFAIFTIGNNEYQCLQNLDFDELAITLFRGVSYIGRRNLLYRRGRASGINDYPHATPESNLNKELKFNLSLTTNIEENKLNKNSKEYNQRSCYYQVQSINQFQWMGDTFVLSQRKILNNKKELNLLSIENMDELVCTTIKKAWKGKNNLIRLYNPTNKTIVINSKQIISEVDLMDKKIKEKLILEIRPNQVKTYEFETLIKKGKNE